VWLEKNIILRFYPTALLYGDCFTFSHAQNNEWVGNSSWDVANFHRPLRDVHVSEVRVVTLVVRESAQKKNLKV